jgi:hypothetical protein
VVGGATVVDALFTGSAVVLNHFGAFVVVVECRKAVVIEVVLWAAVVGAPVTGLAVELSHFGVIVAVAKVNGAMVLKL